MARQIKLFLESGIKYLEIKKDRNLLASEKSLLLKMGQEEIIYHSKVMTDLLEKADQVAGTESTVLIFGETGTGKELLAKRIHEHSDRANYSFIIVDVTTIPENLLESELFGHERGAFTGADSRKIGRLELAHRGTLFLDEIGELPLTAQTKLLRVLQEKNFTRLGGTQSISSDFRLIVATNRNLREDVVAGRFRQDLYYRLNVIPLFLHPLRERPLDIPLLADYYLKHFALKYKHSNFKLTDEQEKMLCRYQWPGNIRELKNIIERAVLLSKEKQLELDMSGDIRSNEPSPFDDTPKMEELQYRYIDYILKRTGGKISGRGGAAEILGMNRTTLYSRLKVLRIRP